jgi:hypothetical protein
MTYDEMIEAGMDRNEAKLFSTIFFVEATHTEQFYLWKEYHEGHQWVQDSEGFYKTIGFIKDDTSMPVTVSFSFIEIHGKRVCFYEATSIYVDHNMVQEYIKSHYPVKWDNNMRTAMTDAMNFHHAIDASIEK